MKDLHPKITSSNCYLYYLRNLSYFTKDGKAKKDYIRMNFLSAVEDINKGLEKYFFNISNKSPFVLLTFNTDLYSSSDSVYDEDNQMFSLNLVHKCWDYHTPYKNRNLEFWRILKRENIPEKEYFAQAMKELTKTDKYKDILKDILLCLDGLYNCVEFLPTLGLEYNNFGGFEVDYEDIPKMTERFLSKKESYKTLIRNLFQKPMIGANIKI